MSKDAGVQTDLHIEEFGSDWRILSEGELTSFSLDVDEDSGSSDSYVASSSVASALASSSVAVPQVEPDGDAVQLMLSQRSMWPDFPRGYWNTLGKAHIHWGGSKSQKYEVRAMAIDDASMANWARPRFAAWLRARGLSNIARENCVGVFPFPRHPVQFIKYDYCAPQGVPSLYPSTERTETLYHGTYAQCLARILATQYFIESDESLGMGMENHTGIPVVFVVGDCTPCEGLRTPLNHVAR